MKRRNEDDRHLPPQDWPPTRTTNAGGIEVTFGGDNMAPKPTKIPPRRSNSENSSRNSQSRGTGPVDLDALDDLFRHYRDHEDSDAGSFFESDEGYDSDDDQKKRRFETFFQNPNAELLNKDATNIPGSPWAKPATRKLNRPSEPLPIAKYASGLAFIIAVGWVVFLFVMAVWNYTSPGRIVVEMVLACLSFFGLFWNSYFTVASIIKCFIPAQAFKSNTKYFSMVPEVKQPQDPWLDVTIQIPVYKESLQEVLMPTLKSCMRARDHYISHSQAHCNIVVCDDGIMAFLNDNFPAAEMLWENVVETKGKVIRLSQILKRIPRVARRHLKGLRSKNIYEVFHRMLFYYHYQIGWVARSTIDRRGKFKKASNLNTHLRLMFGAEELSQAEGKSFEEALLEVSHSDDGARYIMFGNNIRIGQVIIVNDADARMQPPVIIKTVPEFLNDKTLGFTQHATKTMDDQRGESYYLKMLESYTDSLYQGHFLLSSILGCHPPMVGHSIFIRTEAIKQCGRMRSLRKAQRWLMNIGLPFMSVDQVGFGNLHSGLRMEYWSETHVSEDFELMIHLYNIGYNGRYIAYPGCEFQEGVTRTFDEEAGRHRKFSLGAHELIFNPIQEMLGHGIFTPLFKTFITCDIPSYYKIFLTAYLFSYTSGGIYIIVFTIAAITRILDAQSAIGGIYAFSPAGIIVLNILVYYIIGFTCFVIALLRMHWHNKDLFFPEYRNRGKLHLIWKMFRALKFQMFFYSAMGNWYFLGSMDHLLSRPNICSATNKDSITIGRCTALFDTMRFNSGSWLLSFLMVVLAYATIVQEYDWDPTVMPEWEKWNDPESSFFDTLLFAGPAAIFALMTFLVPIFLNPYILGWPFYRRKKAPKKDLKKTESKRFNPDGDCEAPTNTVDMDTFMKTTQELQREIERNQGRPDMELGSLATNDLKSAAPRGSFRKNGGHLSGRFDNQMFNVGDEFNVPGTYNLRGERILGAPGAPRDRTSRDPNVRNQNDDRRPNKLRPPSAGFAI